MVLFGCYNPDIYLLIYEQIRLNNFLFSCAISFRTIVQRAPFLRGLYYFLVTYSRNRPLQPSSLMGNFYSCPINSFFIVSGVSVPTNRIVTNHIGGILLANLRTWLS